MSVNFLLNGRSLLLHLPWGPRRFVLLAECFERSLATANWTLMLRCCRDWLIVACARQVDINSTGLIWSIPPRIRGNISSLARSATIRKCWLCDTQRSGVKERSRSILPVTADQLPRHVEVEESGAIFANGLPTSFNRTLPRTSLQNNLQYARKSPRSWLNCSSHLID